MHLARQSVFVFPNVAVVRVLPNLLPQCRLFHGVHQLLPKFRLFLLTPLVPHVSCLMHRSVRIQTGSSQVYILAVSPS